MIGYARVSRFGADADDQRAVLLALGADPDRVYVDVGLVGMSCPRPALGEALAATRAGDTLVVTSLARLARSVLDAHQLLGRLTARGVTIAAGEVRYRPVEPAGQVLTDVLALAADLLTVSAGARTREGLVAARSRGQLRGRPPKLSRVQERHVVGLYSGGAYTVAEVGELFNVSRSTVYRAARRAAGAAPADDSQIPREGPASSHPATATRTRSTGRPVGRRQLRRPLPSRS